MFAHHRFEILDHFQRDVLFLFAEINESARISAMLGNDYLNRTIWVDVLNRYTLVASS
jgi:hypothetical protein